jgi:glycogen synthase
VKKIAYYILLSLVTAMMIPTGSQANVLENLPRTLETKNWRVVVGKPDHYDTKLNNSTRPEIYNVYSLDIVYTGDMNIELVRVEAYRNAPKSIPTLYELFTAEFSNEKPLEPSFHHSNFPLDTKSTELIVTVTWKYKNRNDRKFKEQFLFQLSK